MSLLQTADRLRATLLSRPEIRRCTLYGSLQNGTADRYSDIDLEIDVSGVDNGQFLFALSGLVAQQYPVVFCDYAPSLAPEKYVVSLAISEKNPFLIVDLACTAVPHCPSVSPQALREKNDPCEHTLKLFTANLKHFLRGADCRGDIARMYARRFGTDAPAADELALLRAVHASLCEGAAPKYRAYLSALQAFLPC